MSNDCIHMAITTGQLGEKDNKIQSRRLSKTWKGLDHTINNALCCRSISQIIDTKLFDNGKKNLPPINLKT